jgi:hypothetical protein
VRGFPVFNPAPRVRYSRHAATINRTSASEVRLAIADRANSVGVWLTKFTFASNLPAEWEGYECAFRLRHISH